MTHYFHSVTLDESLCKGCTNCIKRCPTEAIRVRGGKADIIVERCIDCGECIRTCANHAKTAVTDDFDRLDLYKHRIALLPPAFFGIWRSNAEAARAVSLMPKLGFDEVFEVAIGADIVALATRLLLLQGGLPKPAISSACPAVIRLMQVRFPTLLQNLVPLESPVEIAAEIAKRDAEKRTGLDRKDIAAFMVTPCPAKVTANKQPVGRQVSAMDGAISMGVVYGVLARLGGASATAFQSSATQAAMKWGASGGEAESIASGATLSVDGIHNVINVLDEAERGRLHDIDYIEAQACVGGCLGGCLVPQDPFVGRLRLNRAAGLQGATVPLHSEECVSEWLDKGLLSFDGPIPPRPVMKLDADISRALEMMEELEDRVARLPGLDCGACGSPSCRALAEDIVRGIAVETDCIFLLRERVKELAEEMVELARKVPPSMGQGDMRSGRGGAKVDSR